MSKAAQNIRFPDDLASKILWSPNVDEGLGRSSPDGYVMVTPGTQSRRTSLSVVSVSQEEKDDSEAQTTAPELLAESGLPAADDQTREIDPASEAKGVEEAVADSSKEDQPSQVEPIIPKLPESIQEEMKAYFSYKFSTDVQMESVKSHKAYKEPSGSLGSKIIEPLVHLYCPHVGCHEVIDEAVKFIASREGAEVLTLDTLELSSAETSILGDQIVEALADLYKDPVPAQRDDLKDSSDSESFTESSGNTSDEEGARERRRDRRRRRRAADQRKRKAEKERKNKEKKRDGDRKQKDLDIQAIFDALVSLSPPDGTVTARKRIVYVRDFGSIAAVSTPLVVRLLRAIHARRIAKFPHGVESEELVQPTLLVFGYANAINGYGMGESVFVQGGEGLRCMLPQIGVGVTGQHDNFTSISLSPIGSQFFLDTLVVTNKEQDDDSDDSDCGYDPYAFPPSHPASNGFGYRPASPGCFPPGYFPPGVVWPAGMSMPPNDTHVPRTIFNGSVYSLESFDMYSTSLTMSVFIKNAEKKAITSLEKHLCDRRKTDIANAWFEISLAQRKRCAASNDILAFLGDDEELQKDLARDTDKDKVAKKKRKERMRYKAILIGQNKKKKKTAKKAKESKNSYRGQALLARLAECTNSSISTALDKGVAIVLGMSYSELTIGADGIPDVPLSAFSRAFRTLIHSHRSRSDWWKDPDSENESDKKDDDPVVKSVKEAYDLTEQERSLLSCIVDPNELVTSFDDVCISEKTTETLRTIISLRLKFPGAFTSGVLGRESMGGVVLYGPPGTGKTMVCRAVARECGARMLVIKPSDVMDKFLGESEKLVNAIFSLAHRLAPCLIFVDELDSLFGKRKDDDKKWYRDILAEFLQSMDGLKSAKKNKDSGVVVIGATNRPQDIDEAVIRRLPSRMMVDAPDEKQRKRILELHLRGETLDDDVKLDEIARRTTNYSGSDLKNVCVSAAMSSVKDAIGEFKWEPINSRDVPKAGAEATSNDTAAEANDEIDVAKEKINKRTVKMKHLLAALGDVPGSLSGASTGQSELHRWHAQYGSGAPAASGPRASFGSAAGSGSYGAGGFAGYGYGRGAAGGYGGVARYGAGSGHRYGSGMLDVVAGVGSQNPTSAGASDNAAGDTRSSTRLGFSTARQESTSDVNIADAGAESNTVQELPDVVRGD